MSACLSRLTPRGFSLLISHMRKNSKSASDTVKIGYELMQQHLRYVDDKNFVLYELQGDFGSGKTHFVKGIAKALGINDNIVSPSYVYTCFYPFSENSKTFVHIDAWRINSIEIFSSIGVEDYVKEGNVFAFEWPQAEFIEYLKSRALSMNLQIIHIVCRFFEVGEEIRSIEIEEVS